MRSTVNLLLCVIYLWLCAFKLILPSTRILGLAWPPSTFKRLGLAPFYIWPLTFREVYELITSSIKKMYALIRFTDEEKNRIVPVDDIKKFELVTVNYNKKYLVKYMDDYYPAQIILVKDSIEEIETLTRKKRLPFKNKALLESASESDEEISRRNKKDILPVMKTNLSTEQHFLSVYKTQKKEKDLKQKNDAGNANNLKPHTNLKSDENDKVRDENKSLKQKNEDLKEQVKELTELNISLQRTVISNFQKMFELKSDQKEEAPKVAQEVNGQIHLGRGIFVSKATYNDIWFQSTSGMQFVKNMAVAIFGTEALLKCSVTGKPSNRMKTEIQKCSLDGTKLAAIEDIYRHYMSQKLSDKDVSVEIKSIKTYIRNKISDLTRTAKRKIEKQKTTRGADEQERVEFEMQNDNGHEVGYEENENAENEHDELDKNEHDELEGNEHDNLEEGE